MFLERSVSKGKVYLYLKQYAVRQNYANQKIILYSFGRMEKALQNMYAWKNDFSTFPRELTDIGCTKRDLLSWIRKIETKSKSAVKKIAAHLILIGLQLPYAFTNYFII